MLPAYTQSAGVVSVTTNAASDNGLEKYDYSVTVCCPSNNYIYKEEKISLL